MPRCHVVRQGECLASIAARYGFPSEDDLYQASDNEALRNTRGSALVLAAGDLVNIPDREPTTFAIGPGSQKQLKVQLPPTKLRLKLESEGSPLAGEAFEVHVAGRTRTGSTDGDGVLEVPVPPHATEARVVLTRQNRQLQVRLGHLDPIEDDAGIAARLANLGYLSSASARGDELVDGISRFQRDHHLEVTGTADAELIDALERAHGS